MLQKLQQLIPFEEMTVQRREVLLPAGAVADRVFLIQSGILRESFVEDGMDVTVQFSRSSRKPIFKRTLNSIRSRPR